MCELDIADSRTSRVTTSVPFTVFFRKAPKLADVESFAQAPSSTYTGPLTLSEIMQLSVYQLMALHPQDFVNCEHHGHWFLLTGTCHLHDKYKYKGYFFPSLRAAMQHL